MSLNKNQVQMEEGWSLTGAEIKPDSEGTVNSARNLFQRLRLKNERMIVQVRRQRVFGSGLSLTGDVRVLVCCGKCHIKD